MQKIKICLNLRGSLLLCKQSTLVNALFQLEKTFNLRDKCVLEMELGSFGCTIHLSPGLTTFFCHFFKMDDFHEYQQAVSTSNILKSKGRRKAASLIALQQSQLDFCSPRLSIFLISLSIQYQTMLLQTSLTVETFEYNRNGYGVFKQELYCFIWPILCQNR